MQKETLCRIFVIDDHWLIRTGFAATFSNHEDGISVMGSAATVEEALVNPDIEHCDVVVLDYHLGISNPVANIQLLRQAYPLIKVVVMSYENPIENQLIMFREGAKAFITKDQEREEIVHAIHLACNGLLVVSEEVKTAAMKAKAESGKFSSLDNEERTIILELAEGARTKEIGKELNLSDSAINKKLKKLCNRFGAKSPLHLLQILIRQKEL